MDDYFNNTFVPRIIKIEQLTGDFLNKEKDVAIDRDILFSGDWELSLRLEMMTNRHDIRRMPVQACVILKKNGVVASCYYSDGLGDTAQVILWWQTLIAKASEVGYKHRRNREELAKAEWKNLI